MAKRKANEHAKLRKELDARYRNIAKNIEYSPIVGCDTVAGVGNKSKVGRKICRHKLYGYIEGGDKATHKTERAKLCTFHGKSTEYIMEVRDAYFIEHPDAKVEYNEMYLEVVIADNGKKKKKKKKRDENMGGEDTGMWAYFCQHFCRHYEFV